MSVSIIPSFGLSGRAVVSLMLMEEISGMNSAWSQTISAQLDMSGLLSVNERVNLSFTWWSFEKVVNSPLIRLNVGVEGALDVILMMMTAISYLLKRALMC